MLGDAISCDLPVEAECLRKEGKEELAKIQHHYVTPPPTPYIAYLRQVGAPKGSIRMPALSFP